MHKKLVTKTDRKDRIRPDVSGLSEGDLVEAVFEKLSEPGLYDDDLFLGEPTGELYTETDVLKKGSYGLEDTKTLSMSRSFMCVRQIDGSPGGWLVSLKVLKKGN